MPTTEKSRLQFEDIPAAIGTLLEDMKTIKDEIKEIRKTKPSDDKKSHVPIGIERVSELTGKAVTTLYRYTANGLIPCYKKGRATLFYEDEIVDWVRSGKCESIEEKAAAFGSTIVPLKRRIR